MCFFFSLIPATVWLVIGFFVLYAAVRTDGGLRTFGTALAIWTFIVAGVILLAGAFVTLAGLCPMQAMMDLMNTAPGA